MGWRAGWLCTAAACLHASWVLKLASFSSEPSSPALLKPTNKPPSLSAPPQLTCRSPRLRAEVARVLRARNVPQLVFRHDGLTARQQEIEDVFRQLDEEEQAEQRAFAAGDDEGWLEAEADAAEAAGVGQPPAGNDTRL